jgi:hypothetical protein
MLNVLFIYLFPSHKTFKNKRRMLVYFSVLYIERLQTYDGNSPQHFTDVFIDEIRKTKDPNSSFYGKRGELTMTATLQDLFVAGAEVIVNCQY